MMETNVDYPKTDITFFKKNSTFKGEVLELERASSGFFTYGCNHWAGPGRNQKPWIPSRHPTEMEGPNQKPWIPSRHPTGMEGPKSLHYLLLLSWDITRKLD